jgi:hypothetical protein
MTHDTSPVNSKIEAKRDEKIEDANLNDYVQKSKIYLLKFFVTPSLVLLCSGILLIVYDLRILRNKSKDPPTELESN